MQQVYAYYDLDVSEIKDILSDIILGGMIIEQFKVIEDIEFKGNYTLIIIVRPREANWEELRHAAKLAY